VFIRVIRGQKPLRLRLMAGKDARVPTTNHEQPTTDQFNFQRSNLILLTTDHWPPATV